MKENLYICIFISGQGEIREVITIGAGDVTEANQIARAGALARREAGLSFEIWTPAIRIPTSAQSDTSSAIQAAIFSVDALKSGSRE